MANSHKIEFRNTFNSLTRRHNRYKVFRDFVMMCGISIQNAFLKCDDLEKEYFAIIKSYSSEELHEFPKLMAQLTLGLEENYGDFLGDLFMELEIGESKMGQFFTPYPISRMLAEVTCGDLDKQFENKSFITLSEPACGAGGMVIAFADTMKTKGFNPQQQLFVECWDLDPVASMMCYIQLSLLHIPCKVVTGNTLTLEKFRTFYTPNYYLNNWSIKLEWERNRPEIKDNEVLPVIDDFIEPLEEINIIESNPSYTAKVVKLDEQMSLF